MVPRSSLISANYSVTKSWLPLQRTAELRAELRLCSSLQDFAISVFQVVASLIRAFPRDIQGIPTVGESAGNSDGQLALIEGTAPSLLVKDDEEEGRMAEEQEEPLKPVGWRYEVVSKFESFVGAAGIQYQLLPKLSERIGRERGSLVDFLGHQDTQITAVNLGFEVFKGLIVSGLLGGVPEVRERWQFMAVSNTLTIALWTTLKDDPWTDLGVSRGGVLVRAFAELIHNATGCSLGDIAASGRRV